MFPIRVRLPAAKSTQKLIVSVPIGLYFTIYLTSDLVQRSLEKNLDIT